MLASFDEDAQRLIHEAANRPTGGERTIDSGATAALETLRIDASAFDAEQDAGATSMVAALDTTHLDAAEYDLSGLDDVEEMYEDIYTYLNKWLPRFAASNRSYVTVAIGCTGGQHRSVYLAERLGAALKISLKNIQVRHRDIS